MINIHNDVAQPVQPNSPTLASLPAKLSDLGESSQWPAVRPANGRPIGRPLGRPTAGR